jgi:hypothetical protein
MLLKKFVLSSHYITSKNLVNFLQNDAIVFLKFLYGAAIEEKFKKMKFLIARVDEIRQVREFYYQFLRENFKEDFMDIST